MRGGITLTIAPDHPALPGHFPGEPIIPGVLLLDEALHAIEAAAGTQLAGTQVRSVKFLNIARPGELLCVDYEVSAGGSARFTIKTADRPVASGACTLAARCVPPAPPASVDTGPRGHRS